jgi:hypothetical protein
MLILRPPSPLWRAASCVATNRPLTLTVPMRREPPVPNATFPLSVFDIMFFPFGSFRISRPDGS